MRAIILLLLLIFLVTLFTACNPTLEHLEKSGVSTEYFIETNQTCGWCGGTNYFNLTKGKATFSHDFACNENEDIPVKKLTITDKEWSDLISKLDFDAFQLINLNTCSVCADGCDTEITITKSGLTHSFTYSWLEAEELVEVSEFLVALEALKGEKITGFY
ncbi:MAG: hypothetical protein RIA69_16005 [Cyclobacteriaceae bacterium]